MAERRMFAKTIIDSDAFLDMPMTSQLLYFHLSMRADDEGFINNPKRIQRMIGASDDDLRMLIAKAFIIPFESGVVVIKHWRINNYIQKDRFKETIYSEERKALFTKKDGAYTLDETQAIEAPKQDEKAVETECIQNVYSSDTQVRLGKDIDKKENTPCGGTKEKAPRFSPPTLEDVQKYCQERKNKVDAIRFWNFYESKGWMVGKTKMKDWKASVRTWELEDKKKSQQSQRQSDHKERVYSEDELNTIVKGIGAFSEEDL